MTAKSVCCLRDMVVRYECILSITCTSLITNFSQNTAYMSDMRFKMKKIM
jgi:hypothetical protein